MDLSAYRAISSDENKAYDGVSTAIRNVGS